MNLWYTLAWAPLPSFFPAECRVQTADCKFATTYSGSCELRRGAHLHSASCWKIPPTWSPGSGSVGLLVRPTARYLPRVCTSPTFVLFVEQWTNADWWKCWDQRSRLLLLLPVFAIFFMTLNKSPAYSVLLSSTCVYYCQIPHPHTYSAPPLAPSSGVSSALSARRSMALQLRLWLRIFRQDFSRNDSKKNQRKWNFKKK